MDEPVERESHLDVNGSTPGLDESGDLSAIPAFLQARTAEEIAATGPVARDPFRVDREGMGLAPLPGGVESPDPGTIPLATISPRRLLHIVAIVALAWAVISFGRQVATASAASSHADELRGATAALQDQVSAMQRELTLIQERRYVDLQARAYRLGNPDEIPFALQPNPPALPADAPGSSSVRLGAPSASGGPIDSWLRILFGPG